MCTVTDCDPHCQLRTTTAIHVLVFMGVIRGHCPILTQVLACEANAVAHQPTVRLRRMYPA